MKISIARSGGFSGISLPAKVLQTTDEAIISLCKEVLKTWKDETPYGMDLLSYSITIDNGTESSLIQIQDRLLPEKVQELVNLVMAAD
jgi:hypothetical protein